MANCHSLFIQFDDNLSITTTKKDRLRTSRLNLEEKIKKHFKDNHPGYTPNFFIQGSYKMNTTIRTKNDTCDLDDGIIFYTQPDVSSATLMGWVKDAVDDSTTHQTNIRRKCVRVNYSGDYHIDFPIYKQADDDSSLFLAIKGEDWDTEPSDPKGFVNWYFDVKTDQMNRIIKYLKAWGNKCSKKMPSGLAMTLFCHKYFITNERDDIALYDTLVRMNNGLYYEWKAIMPVLPEDDVLLKYDADLKESFFEYIEEFIKDAKKAIDDEKQLSASKLWRKHLGERFPFGEDEESKSNANDLISSASSSIYKPYFKD